KEAQELGPVLVGDVSLEAEEVGGSERQPDEQAVQGEDQPAAIGAEERRPQVAPQMRPLHHVARSAAGAAVAAALRRTRPTSPPKHVAARARAPHDQAASSGRRQATNAAAVRTTAPRPSSDATPAWVQPAATSRW